ncbi:MAG: mucoidy inhibitor MuiA family protein [Limnothrix sp.]
MSRALDTEITAVTVLSDRAVVTRHGTFAVSPEDEQWVVSPLPMTVAPDSIRVKGKGNISVKFLAIATETIVTIESIDEKVAPIDQRIQQLKTEIQTVGDRLKTLQLQQNFVSNLSDKSIERFAKNLATGQTDLSKTESLLNFVGTQHQELSQQIQAQNEQTRQLTREVRVLEQQKALLRNPSQKRHYALALTVEVSEAGEFSLEISYQVTNAGWIPRYDLTVDTNQQNLTLDYLADVSQSTGENWCNVDLTISTAQIQQGIIPPKLKPWYLNIYQPTVRAKSLAKKSAAPPRPAAAPMSDSFGEAAMEAEESYSEVAAAPIVPDVQRQGSTVTFHVGSGGDIPSDGNPHQVNLFHGEYSITLNHFAIPRRVSFAYLQAKFTNPTDGVTLLPGTANIFRDQTFVGKTPLKNISPGQSVTLNLGIDEALQIERELGDRQVDKTLLSKLRRITYAYTVEVTNLTEQPQTLILQEQIPVSRTEKIKINLQKVDPKIEPTKLGILEWETAIAPNTKIVFAYQYIVEHAPDANIKGLAN